MLLQQKEKQIEIKCEEKIDEKCEVNLEILILD
jgi:hypothetical protein